MAHSLEARAPFLDYQMVAYVLSLPMRVKVAGGTSKHVLKEAVRPLLPAEVINRPKQGFRVPLPAWLAGELAPWAEETLFNSSIHKRNLFNLDYIRWMWERHKAGTFDHSFDLWCLINLAAWYDHWIEGRAAA
jgi:asparagine synthase (glutamine-hydrolysing)